MIFKLVSALGWALDSIVLESYFFLRLRQKEKSHAIMSRMLHNIVMWNKLIFFFLQILFGTVGIRKR